MTRLAIAASLGCAMTLAGCPASKDAAPTAPRCATCGMRVDVAPEFRAGAVAADGAEVAFDSPKCLFRWLEGTRGAGAEGAWVTEWYGQTRQPVAALHFVLGSDVVGPMGHDLVPVLGEDAAKRFLDEHEGTRILRADDVDPTLLEGLDAAR